MMRAGKGATEERSIPGTNHRLVWPAIDARSYLHDPLLLTDTGLLLQPMVISQNGGAGAGQIWYRWYVAGQVIMVRRDAVVRERHARGTAFLVDGLRLGEPTIEVSLCPPPSQSIYPLRSVTEARLEHALRRTRTLRREADALLRPAA